MIVACGQKRSNDMNWSEKVIDLAGGELRHPRRPQLRVRGRPVRVRRAAHRGLPREAARLRARARRIPSIKLAVLEWSLSRTYDWRAGLHAAGSLILYETLSPELTMTARRC